MFENCARKERSWYRSIPIVTVDTGHHHLSVRRDENCQACVDTYPATLIHASHVRIYIYSLPRVKVNILGGHSIGHAKKRKNYVHVSYSERFPR
jgi:hypothetical protein